MGAPAMAGPIDFGLKRVGEGCCGVKNDHQAPARATGLKPAMRLGGLRRGIGGGDAQSDHTRLDVLAQLAQ